MFKKCDCQEIVLLDFGLAKLWSGEKTWMIGMSCKYSAPETFIGLSESIVSEKSDLFSFGMFFCIKFNWIFSILYGLIA